jgi:hypothetical protein
MKFLLAWKKVLNVETEDVIPRQGEVSKASWGEWGSSQENLIVVWERDWLGWCEGPAYCEVGVRWCDCSFLKTRRKTTWASFSAFLDLQENGVDWSLKTICSYH